MRVCTGVDKPNRVLCRLSQLAFDATQHTIWFVNTCAHFHAIKFVLSHIIENFLSYNDNSTVILLSYAPTFYQNK